ncbi:MAG: prepilin-type N-terminal cleavage/methylation domain-containing protein [Puniceicoccales bacterium]|jgi:prepilin-type N-terminal cleavage/methylation domain-containing protein|nr:prepilin-type N-terminal cleavage/methylation domain-containing protein [Puniceicoccales bacterium]
MKTKKSGFSLLEMITVLVIIAIISLLLISGANEHKKAALVAKTRTQFLQYETAISMYCAEYGNLPTFFCDEEVLCMGEGNNSETFIKILSGRDPSGKPLSESDKKALNPKEKTFHRFAESEFFTDDRGNRGDRKVLADAFNNKNIFVVVEDPFDDDMIIPKEKFPEAVRKYIKGDGVKNSVVIFSISDDENMVISNCLDQFF